MDVIVCGIRTFSQLSPFSSFIFECLASDSTVDMGVQGIGTKVMLASLEKALETSFLCGLQMANGQVLPVAIGSYQRWLNN